MTNASKFPQDDAPRCTGCGALDPVKTPWEDALCPECARRYAVAYAAADHLRFLLRDALSDFLRVWGHDVEVRKYLADAASLNAEAVAEELLAEVQG